ncbi:flagellin [Alicyclobacillus fodiniaquatilis]|uniref:Flagellin n=1 Tax=Alicyclobacillus fodiniaquatilis TaxID=1661150 RepID=A0ABW4JHS0_9BACL
MSGMIIGHNLGAMDALSALNSNSNALNSALQQLSTGKKINSAADDASGYAISQEMQSQINGLNQASSNAQDGISLIQTASGALNETNGILQQMRQLAVQASNDTNTSTDRTNIQQEMNQLTDEVNRIAGTTQFNTQNILQGGGSSSSATTASASITSASGALNGISSLDVSGASTLSTGKYEISMSTATLDTTATASTATGSLKGVSTTLDVTGLHLSSGSYTLTMDASGNVSLISGTVTIGTATATSGKELTIDGISMGTITSAAAGTMTFTISGSTDEKAVLSNASGTAVSTAYLNTGSTLTIDGINTGTVTSAATGTLNFSFTAGSSGTSGASGDFTAQLQIGANQGQNMTISIGAADAVSLGIATTASGTSGFTSALSVSNGQDNTNIQYGLDVSSATAAGNAITVLNNAIDQVSQEQGQLGAYQNRLTHTINNLSTSSQNLTSAESGITDTDMATEMAQYTQDNVLQQAAVSMLAQANQQPQLVLKLLG